MSIDSQPDRAAFIDQLQKSVLDNLDQPATNWLQEKLSKIELDPKAKELYLTFSAMPRFTGKSDWNIDEGDLVKLKELKPGFSPEGWNVTRAARVLLLAHYPFSDEEEFHKITSQLFTTAEVNESVALYSALPVLPYPESLKAQAAEGVRTNMSVVFDAVVLNNPYPSEYLDQGAWNQMVLKALFMERPLYRIYGLEKRSNMELSKMISNYAHERWAAGRDTSPEMWRPITDQGTLSIYQDLQHLLTLEEELQHAAAILTARKLKTREAQAFLDQNQPLVDKITETGITWDEIGKRWWSKRNQN